MPLRTGSSSDDHSDPIDIGVEDVVGRSISYGSQTQSDVVAEKSGGPAVYYHVNPRVFLTGLYYMHDVPISNCQI